VFVNTLKRKLLSGEHCFGILDSTCSPEIVEMLGYLGFDFVLLDAEHGKLNLENLENLIRAAELSGTAPIVRPPVTASEWISPMLDRGAWGVYLPHFSTVEDAELAVRTCKYAPQGMRGYMPVGRPNRFGYEMPVPEFLKASNEEMLIIGLVEDAEGLDNLDDMLKVEGIDAFWIGAGDLSQSMGYPGQADHPVVMEAMDEAVRKIVAAGKVAGWAGADHLIPRYMGLGALLFHGLVQGLVRTGADAYLKQRHDEMAALAG
jgi:4-hydroxy-2-oxoheptanedioate aldolase